jgi:MFS family permease
MPPAGARKSRAVASGFSRLAKKGELCNIDFVHWMWGQNSNRLTFRHDWRLRLRCDRRGFMDLHSLRRLPSSTPVSHIVVPSVRFRLSVLMFLLYSAPGAIVPLFTMRLRELGFSPTAAGWCCATQALGALLAPLLAGQIADRWIPAERCLTVCAVISAVLLALLSTLTTPLAVFAASLVFWLVMAPALTLSTAVSFSHLTQPGREFGKVRMWGTLGWVAPNWLLGFWFTDSDWVRQALAVFRPEQQHGVLSDAFLLGSIMAVLFGLYSLTLPHTPPRRTGTIDFLAPWQAVKALWGRPFAIYALCTFGASAVLPFATQVGPLLFSQLGVSASWLPRLLTIAQASEVATLFLMPWILQRFGVRGTMRLGLAAAVLTLTGLMIGQPLGVAIAGLSLYGVCIGCYLVAGQMYLNHQTSDGVRASAQALHSVLCGIGLLVGSLLVGFVRELTSDHFGPTFAVAAAGAAVLFIIFVIGFPRRLVLVPKD